MLAEKTGVIRFLHRREERLGLADELAADVDIGGTRAHREARDQRAFDQLVRIVADDFAVLARTGFGFVGVDDAEARAVGARLLRHEAPFEPGRAARAAAAAQARRLHPLDAPALAALPHLLAYPPTP